MAAARLVPLFSFSTTKGTKDTKKMSGVTKSWRLPRFDKYGHTAAFAFSHEGDKEREEKRLLSLVSGLLWFDKYGHTAAFPDPSTCQL
jgi:hypothetical protein